MNNNIPKTIKKLFPTINPYYAKGSWVYTNTKKYLDFTSGIGTLSTGHNHPRIIRSVKNQLNMYVHTPQQVFGNHNTMNAFINKFLTIMPYNYLDTIFFVNSGSEATDNALKLAKGFTGRNNIIALTNGFHGRTVGALQVTSSNTVCKSNMGINHSGVFFMDVNTENSLKTIFENYINPEEVAAVIVEPVQGEGGVISIKSNILQNLHKECKQHGILLIADEVQCGMGRTGTMWNIEQKKIKPDILTFGKGIGSGFPLAGVVSNNKIMNYLNDGFLGGTYGGNAVSLAAGIETMNIIKEEKLLDNTVFMGNYLKHKLLEIPNIKKIIWINDFY